MSRKSSYVNKISDEFILCRNEKCLELFNKLVPKLILFNKLLNGINNLFNNGRITPQQYKEKINATYRKMYKYKIAIDFNKCMLDNCYDTVMENIIFLLKNFIKYNVKPTPKLQQEQYNNIRLCSDKTKKIKVSQYLKILYQIYKII